MFQAWRLKLREATTAYRAGRLDEAVRLLTEDRLFDYYPSRKLAGQLADQLLLRARATADQGESLAGWRDLEAASVLGGTDQSLREVREALVARGLAEVKRKLEAGNTAQALERLVQLEKRHESTSRTEALREAALLVDQAQKLQRRGQFAAAETRFASAQALAPDVESIGKWRETCERHVADSRDRCHQLHRALADENWTDALAEADALLAIAPENSAAATARRMAWRAVGMRPSHAGTGHPPRANPGKNPWLNRDETPFPAAASSKVDTVKDQANRPRSLLWVDAVGGYLVCLADRIVIGQPAATTVADVPILADLSRRHAMIRRDGESYLLEPIHSARIDGRPVQAVTALADGQLIELGSSVQLRFRKPHPLSATARLDLVSHHKTVPSCDGVLLMADTCVLGPKPQCHVPCRDFSDEVVLFREGHQLFCHAVGVVQIDGRPCDGRGALATRCQVEGDDYSFSLEPV